MPTDRYTTNIHEPREHGIPGGRRVKLVATGSGELVWCELYDADGSLRGCGPTLVGLDGRLLDLAQDRLSFAPDQHPLYWRRPEAT